MRPRMIYGSVYNTRVIVGGWEREGGVGGGGFLHVDSKIRKRKRGGEKREMLLIEGGGITNVEYRFRCK